MTTSENGGRYDVAVVVATHDRAGLLPRLVAALERQTLGADRFEVVIVDDASTDGTPAVLAALAKETTLDLRYLRLDVNGGPAVARNAGVAATRAPRIAFTDDDCVPSPGWLAALLAAAGDDPVLVVGRTAPAPDQPRGPFSRTLDVTDATYAQTCNVLYRREDLLVVGGFDVALRTGEDTDLSLRVRATAVAARFAEDALVHHDVSPSSVAAAVRSARRWQDLPGVVRRHPHLRREVAVAGLFWKRSHPPAVLGLVATALALLTGRQGWLLGWTPWLRHRLVVDPLVPGRRAVTTLPGALAVDVTEVVTMVQGSIEHRTPIL